MNGGLGLRSAPAGFVADCRELGTYCVSTLERDRRRTPYPALRSLSEEDALRSADSGESLLHERRARQRNMAQDISDRLRRFVLENEAALETISSEVCLVHPHVCSMFCLDV